MDLGDVLLNTLKLFRGRSDILDEYRKKYRHVMVDEFQDISPAQYDILRMLVVGQGAVSGNMAGTLSGSTAYASNPGEGDILNPLVLQVPEADRASPSGPIIPEGV